MADSIKALEYAEQNLGVHEVYGEAKAARDTLQNVIDNLIGARFKKREWESVLADREMELVIEERGKHPEFSATAMDAHMKRIKHTDEKCKNLRIEIAGHTNAIDALEHSKTMAEYDIKIAVARLQELGGYLEYLAAVKQHQARNASEA